MNSPIVFDIETQYSFAEVKHDLKKLKVSVVGTYDYNTSEYKAYTEEQMPQLFSKMEHASFLIGFNSNKFDLPVLSPYYIGNVTQFHSLDLLEEVEKALGFRISLDDLAKATLNTHKSGHGLMAIEYFRNGEMEKLKKYCLDDVRITKELYEYGLKNKILKFQSARGLREIPISFDYKKPSDSLVALSLPF